jgi:hypothetical protein
MAEGEHLGGARFFAFSRLDRVATSRRGGDGQ